MAAAMEVMEGPAPTVAVAAEKDTMVEVAGAALMLVAAETKPESCYLLQALVHLVSCTTPGNSLCLRHARPDAGARRRGPLLPAAASVASHEIHRYPRRPVACKRQGHWMKYCPGKSPAGSQPSSSSAAAAVGPPCLDRKNEAPSQGRRSDAYFACKKQGHWSRSFNRVIFATHKFKRL
ncbi:hypothetical protein NL676_017705 [Syzygium grande]|nr:hypothetical protein NL676_017705 [Syzygium grande]